MGPLVTAKMPDGTLAAAHPGVRHGISAIDLRFGTAQTPKVRRDVARLTVLPSPTSPAAILLGPRADRHSAVFQVGANVAVTGDGTCVPRRRLCTQLILRSGEHAVLTRADGKVMRLFLVHVRTRRTTSLGKAIRAAQRQSAVGRCVYDQIAAYDYDVRTGTVRRAADPSGCRYPKLGAAAEAATP
jgi:hypothetical protein